MNIAVVGSRKINVEQEKYILDILSKEIKIGDCIISGGARGVDSLAEWYAKNKNFKYYIFRPDMLETQAFKKRNQLIADACNTCIAFPSKESRGTWDTINRCMKLNKKVLIYEI